MVKNATQGIQSEKREVCDKMANKRRISGASPVRCIGHRLYHRLELHLMLKDSFESGDPGRYYILNLTLERRLRLSVLLMRIFSLH